MFAFGLGSSCSDNPTGGEDGDTTRPTVQSVSPANGTVEVEVTTPIIITFSEPIDSDDLNATNICISPSVTVGISRVSSTVTVTPASDLAWDTEYSVTLDTALSDTAGNNLANEYIWSFTTKADPNGAPPTIQAVWPTENAQGVAESTAITASFSKPMDLTSLESAFAITERGGSTVAGSIGFANPVATFIPDSPLEYNTIYDVAITTAAKDTFDINLATRKDWSFTTRANPNVPILNWITPGDSTIIEDTITVVGQVVHPTGVDSTVLFVNGNRNDVNPAGALFLFDASLFPIGVGHRLHLVSYADGLIGYSDTLTIFQKWELLDEDLDPIGGIPQDMQRIYYRTTSDNLEFRFEFSADWSDPVNDTALDMAMFIDADQNELTGRTDFGGTGGPGTGNDLNDIGAEKRIIIGIHGATALANWNQSSEVWDSIAGPEIFTGLMLPSDTNIFEFGISWLDLDNTNFIDLIAINAFFLDAESPIYDWSPDDGAVNPSHHTIRRADRYIGPGVITPTSPVLKSSQAERTLANPFD